MDLLEKKARLEADLARLNIQIRAEECNKVGHDWVHIGNRSAYCDQLSGDSCGCSIPVHECSKCGDSDYGENDEAREIITYCKEESIYV